MDKRVILNLVTNKVQASKEDKAIIEAIKRAKDEWEEANEFFQQVDEAELIDYAIFLEQAARVRYMYLLRKAKEKNIKVDYYESLKIAEDF